jgi:transposase
MHYIGMDVHKKVTMLCVLDENGKILREAVVKGSLGALVARLKVLRRELGGPAKICYEASGGCGWLHDRLAALGYKVQVAHPGKLRMIFRSKRKNDRVDAQKLAKLLYLDEVPLAYIPQVEIRQWRSLIEYRHGLVVRRGGAKRRLRALLHSEGVEAPRGLWSQKGRLWLTGVDLPQEPGLQRELLLAELEQLEGLIRRVDQVLAKKAAATPGVGLLMTIPGVGIRTAEAVVVYMADPERFRRNKSVGCYFGLVPCEDTSVQSRFGHITKEGPGTVRWLVTEATWQAVRRDATMKSYFERVCRDDPQRKKIALIATAHHLLRVMHAMLRTGEVWRSAAA